MKVREDCLKDAAPDMLAALKAEQAADAEFDAADVHTHRAEAEGWLTDPTGSLHVSESWNRAHRLRQRAKELRIAAIAKATGGAECLYCGATDGLRTESDGGGFMDPEYVCRECFRGGEDISFEDLSEAPLTSIQMAYGLLWRTLSRDSLANDARKYLLPLLTKRQRQAAIDWATRLHGVPTMEQIVAADADIPAA